MVQQVDDLIRNGALRRANHFETITRSAVPVRRGHAPDEMKIFASDALLLGIKQLVAQMQAFDRANDDSIATNLKRAPFLAFQANR